MNARTILGLLVLAGAALQAQTTFDYRAKLGLVSAQGHLLGFTGKHQGYFYELGVGMNLKDPDLNLYFHAGNLNVGRDDSATANYAKAKNFWVGLDLQYPVTEKLSLFTGPTMNQWDITPRVGRPYAGNSFKMGWRLGAKYHLHKRYSVEALYGLSEYGNIVLRNLDGTTPTSTSNNTRARHPSWFTMGVTYQF